MDPLVAPRQMLGQVLGGRYRLLEVAREGEVGDVFEAQDERLQRRVAVRLFDGEVPDLASLDHPNPDRVLDAGDHEGHGFVVLPLADGVASAGTGVGDDEPTGELPIAAGHTEVLPMPLVPVPEPTSAPEPTPGPSLETSRRGATIRTIAAGLWARRVLLAAVAGVALFLLLGLAARGDDGLDVPTQSSVPVTAETTTTIAPTTTTSPPTTEQRDDEGRGKGKKGKGDDEDD